MNDDIDRKILINEIIVLEESVVSSGSTNIDFPTDPGYFESFSTSDLRAMKNRFERLVRSLGGVKRQ
jgi:hypothetical protein